ncbi:hypothetical protein DCAR_0104771 [Daucus carota subsp. sativus]|uniref:LOB domain-containing protein n=1 Tax=Daucus carota subsp. sativus TaxID=79200 RepID=A0A166J3L4_DAUCS|nr:PREDICTED: LOB domain-containing protein 7-like [Daucus carota subsp. sativus]XP_017254973.1 PREDICTED: LOB domain-containing protein 7-like [Daucus carota subsp. sativus]WOG85580.1 hypothetical protein DCAR_0104771 [Daucus carota subsp. sativus]
MTGPAGGSSVSQACAACKHQRRKCAPECVLAPFFPPHRQAEFLNVHKLFGVRNIMNTVKKVEMSRRGDAVRSMVHEAYFRAVDPAGGAYRILSHLQHRYNHMKAELDLVRQQLAIFRSVQIDGIGSEHMQHPPLNYSNFGRKESAEAINQTDDITSPRINILRGDIIKKEGSSSNRDKKTMRLEKKGSASNLDNGTFESAPYDGNGNTKIDNIDENHSSSRSHENETNSLEDVKLNVRD